jgi:hypothetical protein
LELTVFVRNNLKKFFGGVQVDLQPGGWIHFDWKKPPSEEVVATLPASLKARVIKFKERNRQDLGVRVEHALLRPGYGLSVRKADVPTVKKALDAIADSVLSGDGTSLMTQVRDILAGK